ncbi:MAG: hypothetical protein AB8B88_05310 [Devosiaceae bacterium]
MNAESLIGWSEAAFLTVGLLAIALLMVRVFHPANREKMNDHANIIFRGEDAPEPLEPGRISPHSTARQD